MKRMFIPVCGLIFLFFFAGVNTIKQRWKSRHLAPIQPIAFSHEIHAGQLKLPCLHCHRYADKGPRATAPALSICMQCHEKAATDRPEVQKLIQHWKEKKPVTWIRVYHVPWHVRFVHKAHLRRGIACQTCHGPVQTMKRIRRVRALQMGWCVSCHREHQAPTDCWTCHK